MLCFIEHDAVFKAQNGDALGLQISIPFVIVCDSLGSLVNGSIALHDQLLIGAIEVAGILSKLMLSPELRIVQLPIPKQLPEHILRRRLLFPQVPCPFFETRKIKPTSIMPPLSPWERGWG